MLLLFFLSSTLSANDIVGFWMTIDDHTKRPSSIIAIYPYEGRYYGRIIGTYNQDGVLDDTIYNPKSRAPGIRGNPHYAGLDIVTINHPRGSKYTGYVMDPRNGKVYDAEVWRQSKNLVLRGKVLIFGRNVVWPPFDEKNFTKDFKKPDLASFVPNIQR